METRINEELYRKYAEIVGEENALRDEPMSAHTTFHIGGPADLFVMPNTAEELKAVLKLSREAQVPCTVIGNGSNLLVADRGVRGVVVQLFRNWNDIEQTGNTIRARAGAMLTGIARVALNCSLTGLEFASGIPGTLGGAVIMNAGAYGGEMKQVVREVKVLTQEGEILTLSGDEMEFGYRTSVAGKNGWIILEAVMELEPGDHDAMKARMDELREQRMTKQPLDLPSAGSTFKRPEGYFAGKLIQDCGLRGFTVGGAQVSEKHCGFVVNRGGATAADVRELMRQVSEKVHAEYGVWLEPEVKMLGEFE